jgi:hypothetical protein
MATGTAEIAIEICRQTPGAQDGLDFSPDAGSSKKLKERGLKTAFAFR